MGGGSSKAQVQTTGTQKNINKSIEEKIQAQRNVEKNVVKILLLGAGECGKSTILKQMKILHMDGFSKEEEEEAKNLVFKNTLDSIQCLITACKDLKCPLEGDGIQAKADEIMKIDSSDTIPLSIGPDIFAVWKDEGCQKVKKLENQFHLLDSAAYFLDKVVEYFTPEFVPTTQDSLRTRLTTTGIIETEFELENMPFKMFDVGGQRGERKKWIHCFDDVTAIMFIASLSEYNQVLAEDRTKNRLDESLDLFDGIANLPWFEKAAVILFLNKNDLFEMKVVKFDIGDYHPEYTGGLNYDAGLQFIKDEYFDRNEDEDKTLYCHVTDATNTENVAFVWTATQHIILQSKMAASGLAM
jgi:guanine nucleotide-binding protein G(i) subunit alpha